MKMMSSVRHLLLQLCSKCCRIAPTKKAILVFVIPRGVLNSSKYFSLPPFFFASSIFPPNEQCGGGGGRGGGKLPDFIFSSLFSPSADHERNWLPCKVVFRVGNQYAEC